MMRCMLACQETQRELNQQRALYAATIHDKSPYYYWLNSDGREDHLEVYRLACEAASEAAKRKYPDIKCKCK